MSVAGPREVETRIDTPEGTIYLKPVSALTIVPFVLDIGLKPGRWLVRVLKPDLVLSSRIATVVANSLDFATMTPA